jgi:hypothetical protein
MDGTHAIHRVTDFAIVAPYTVRVAFEDDTSQVIDLGPLLRGELYGPLHDPAVFERVVLDPDAGTLVWPNGADFDPATLHDWPTLGAAMRELARAWK